MRVPRWAPLVALLAGGAGCGGQGTDLSQLVNADADGGSTGQSSGGSTTTFQDPFSGAPAYAAQGSGGDNSHNAGKSCMDKGCHSTSGGGEAPAFLIGGTVYKDYYSMTPAVGVEVRIVDPAGNAASAYSDRGGNFYIRSGSNNGVTFPAIVGARDGTTTRPMITTLSTAAMGSCAQSPCHVVAGSPAMGTYYPIHVP